MTHSETLDVIAVGAHPDDCEIGCGGTLAQLAQQGYRVGIVDLTDGEPTPLCESPAIRIAEAHAAAECLGLTKRIILDLPNRRLFDSFEARVALATEFRRYRPRLVIGLGGKTPLASPDHWQAMQITDAAVFYSRLSKWDDQFNGLPVHAIERQVYYSLMFSGPWTENNIYPIVTDISTTLETKLAAIRCYQTQFPATKDHIFQRLRALAIANGAMAGFDAGELFQSTAMVGSKNLMQTLLGS